jgi:uncharacterized protein (TIGR02594 family)
MPNIRVPWPDDPAHLHAAFSKLGLSEIQGAKHEKQVLAMYAAADHPEITTDETPWCSAFACWALEEGGEPSTNSLMARSYEKYGKPADPRKPAPRGAVAVWPRGKPPSGHVNFVLGEVIKEGVVYLVCIGGNQSNGKGGGVTISETPKGDAIAIRIPPGMAKAIAVPLPRPRPPTPDIEEPERIPPPSQIPLPRSPGDPETEAGPGLIRRIRNWVVGGMSGVGGLSFLGYLTDWQVVAVLVAFVILLAALMVGFLLWLFGKDRVRDWLSKLFNKQVIS